MALIPSREEIAKFRTSVRPSVLSVVDLYEGFIDADPTFGPADFFVQPFLANYLPDLVVGTPHGLLVLEVFDGDVEDQDAIDRFKIAREKARFFRSAFRDLCFPAVNDLCTRLKVQHPGNAALGIVKSLVNAAVIAPGSTTERVRSDDLGPSQVAVYGRPGSPSLAPWPSTAEANAVPTEHQEGVLQRCREVARAWLAPPFHRAEDGRIGQAQLTRAQLPHATPRGSGWFRLQGPAGSGKSMILAHKAAVLASQGKDVLIVCFNITLRNYLRDLVNQMRYDFAWQSITIRHVHELFKEIRLWFHASTPGDPENKEDFLERAYPECAERLVRLHGQHRFRYDAVLVDEGQDFTGPYIRVLAACMKEDAELLLIRDRGQNIYDRNSAWCESGGPSVRLGKGVRGFDGDWATLKTTWRMSPAITRAVSEFAARELRTERFATDDNRQPTLFPAATFCRWENVTAERLLERTVQVATEASQRISPTHPSDLAVLAYTNDRAWQVIDALRIAGIPAVHVYDHEGKRRRDKLFEFCRGDGRIKVCTGHSFKGFELWGVIVLAERIGDHSQRHWLYTCMGRAIEGLWVLNADPEMNGVLDWFPQS